MITEVQTYIDKVTTLDHKIFYNTMKCTAFIANWDAIFPIFTSTKLPARSKNAMKSK